MGRWHADYWHGKTVVFSTLMDAIDLLIKAWPVLFAIVTLIIVLSKLDLRVAVLEDKIKTLFDLVNRK
jgi:hypothetical protein